PVLPGLKVGSGTDVCRAGVEQQRSLSIFLGSAPGLYAPPLNVSAGTPRSRTIFCPTSNLSRVTDFSRTYASVFFPFAQIVQMSPHWLRVNFLPGRASQLSESLQPFFSALEQWVSQVNIGVNLCSGQGLPSISFSRFGLGKPLSGSQQRSAAPVTKSWQVPSKKISRVQGFALGLILGFFRSSLGAGFGFLPVATRAGLASPKAIASCTGSKDVTSAVS